MEWAWPLLNLNVNRKSVIHRAMCTSYTSCAQAHMSHAGFQPGVTDRIPLDLLCCVITISHDRA